MKDQNLAFIDIETTGLNPDKHEIIEIGYVIASQKWTGSKCELTHLDEGVLKIKPERIHDADPQALRVNGYDPSEWVFAYTLKEAMQIFATKTKSCIFVAHNACFDYGFIDKAFRDAMIRNEMHYHKLDTLSMSFAKLGFDNTIDRYSLKNLCDHYGIKNENAHTALADTKALYEVYQKMM